MDEKVKVFLLQAAMTGIDGPVFTLTEHDAEKRIGRYKIKGVTSFHAIHIGMVRTWANSQTFFVRKWLLAVSDEAAEMQAFRAEVRQILNEKVQKQEEQLKSLRLELSVNKTRLEQVEAINVY